jgi:RimJ/RimL family protein N-acetyltransferase
MLECLSAMLDYCFTKLSLHRMQSMVEPDNPASWKLIEKLGFHPANFAQRNARTIACRSAMLFLLARMADQSATVKRPSFIFQLPLTHMKYAL